MVQRYAHAHRLNGSYSLRFLDSSWNGQFTQRHCVQGNSPISYPWYKMDPDATYLVSLIEEWYKDDPDRLAFLQEHWRGPTGKRLRWTNNLVDLPHLFITVNLPLTKTASALYAEVLSLAERFQWARGALCTLEFDPHPHLHMLVRRDAFRAYHKGNLVKVLARALKVKPERVDVKSGVTRADFNHRAAYVRGEKVDEHKRQRCANDARIRAIEGIPDCFNLGGETHALPP